MPFLLLNLALIFSFFCQGLFANSDLFSLSSGSDETATTSYSLLTPNDQETILNEGPLLNIEDPSANWDLFATNDPDGNLLSDNNLLSACPSDSNNAQPSKMRARDTSCPSNYDLPPKLPKLPDIGEDLKEADGPNRQFVWLINVDGVTIGADEPKYYCLPHTPLYSIPVCGSGILSDRWFGHPPLYPQIDKCSLSKSTYLSPRPNRPSQNLAMKKKLNWQKQK